MRRSGFLALALAASLTVACGDNNRAARNDAPANGSAVGTTGEDRITNGDKDFVHEIGIASMAEVELGKMAAERGMNANVKKFGQMMVDDHTKAGDALKSVASRHNIPMPTELDGKHRDLRDTLSKVQGADFDREYMKAMVDGHQEVVDKLESRIDKAKLAEWKAAAADRVRGTKVEERGKLPAVLPENGDNPATNGVNQWAADSYPVVYSHLESAKSIESGLNQRRNTTQ
jgi:putative membrane protein